MSAPMNRGPMKKGPGERLRIVVLGYVVRRPLGGGTWPFVQYALGLLRLGHDVYLVEDSEDYGCCYDPSRHVTDDDPTFGLRYAARVFDELGLGRRWTYYDAHRETWHGPIASRAREVCGTADLVVNVSGINPIRPWLADVPVRAYIDTDPAFEQVRHAVDRDRRRRALDHNVFFTYGENIPAGRSRFLPDVRLPWIATRQPVVLERWPVTPPPAAGRLTTVMLWNSYAKRAHAGQRFGMKSESFEPYRDLPARTAVPLEMALGGPDAPRRDLAAAGWSIVNPLEPTADPWTYQRYLRDSLGEFTVAKHGYVVSRCGWFSERSAHYLASGRPVITQDTGFGDVLPTGDGLWSFATPDEALGAIETVAAAPERHGRAAREIAEAHFDSDRVLSRLVDLAMQNADVGVPDAASEDRA